MVPSRISLSGGAILWAPGHAQAAQPIGTRDGAANTGLEFLLLIVIIALLPLEENIPTVAGVSFSWILFGIAAIYVAFNRIRELTVVASCPVAVTLYLFMLTSTLVESAHVDPWYEEIGRIGQMMAGAILVAAICRDRGR